MALCYASGPMPDTAPTVTVNIGGGSLSAGNYIFTYHAENIAGYTTASPEVAVAIANGDSITIALPPNANTEISEWLYFHVAARLSSQPASASYRVALWNGVNSQGAEITLSAVTITSDSALADPGDNVVATPDDLPVIGAIAGTTRFVSSTGLLYAKTPFQTASANGTEIILDSNGEKWTQWGGSPYLGLVTNPSGESGCDSPINAIDPRLLKIPVFAFYTPASNIPVTQSRGIGYYYRAEETLLKDLPFRFVARLGNSIDSTTDILNQDMPDSGVMSEKIKIRFKGYVNTVTGELDTADITTDTGLMNYVGEDIVWQPTRQQFYIPKDCSPPWAMWIEILPYYSQSDFRLLPGETCWFNLDMGREVPSPLNIVTREEVIALIVALS